MLFCNLSYLHGLICVAYVTTKDVVISEKNLGVRVSVYPQRTRYMCMF